MTRMPPTILPTMAPRFACLEPSAGGYASPGVLPVDGLPFGAAWSPVTVSLAYALRALDEDPRLDARPLDLEESDVRYNPARVAECGSLSDVELRPVAIGDASEDDGVGTITVGSDDTSGALALACERVSGVDESEGGCGATGGTGGGGFWEWGQGSSCVKMWNSSIKTSAKCARLLLIAMSVCGPLLNPRNEQNIVVEPGPCLGV